MFFRAIYKNENVYFVFETDLTLYGYNTKYTQFTHKPNNFQMFYFVLINILMCMHRELSLIEIRGCFCLLLFRSLNVRLNALSVVWMDVLRPNFVDNYRRNIHCPKQGHKLYEYPYKTKCILLNKQDNYTRDMFILIYVYPSTVFML